MNLSRAIKADVWPRPRARYAQRGREGRSRMLDALCQDYHHERKYAIKLLGGKLPAPSGRKPPGPDRQSAVIEAVVRTIWLAAEEPGGQRLARALALWLPHCERHHGRLGSRQRELIGHVSSATLNRLLAPARTDNWDIERPGLGEADTVAHCGTSLAGDLIWSTTFTDIDSAGTEGRAGGLPPEPARTPE